MKVQKIQLNEAPSNTIKNTLRNQLMSISSGNGNKIKLSREEANKVVNEFAERNKDNNDQAAMEEEARAIIQEYKDRLRNSANDVEGNVDLKGRVKNLVDNIDKASSDEIRSLLIELSSKASIPSNNIEANLEAVNTATLRSFITAFQDDLLNSSSRVWSGFGNRSAKDIMASIDTFPLFYNLLIDKSLKLDANYLNNGNSVIYNKRLYTDVKDADDRASLVELDIYEKVPNAELNKSINDGTYSKYISDASLGKKEVTPRATRVLAEVKKVLDNMSEPERINFLSLMFNVDNAKATELYKGIK